MGNVFNEKHPQHIANIPTPKSMNNLTTLTYGGKILTEKHVNAFPSKLSGTHRKRRKK
jgi:hypothetical protein